MKTTSVASGAYFKPTAQLRAAIYKGLESGIAEDFEPASFLQNLKVRHNG